MLICKTYYVRWEMQLLINTSSDATDPQKQSEQILAITPILKGQKPNEKNPIPLHRSESRTEPAPVHEKTPVQVQAPAAEDDLIDFGQNDAPAPVQQPQLQIPTDLKVAQTENNGQRQKDLESTLRSTSTSPPPHGQSTLIDFHNDLKKDLPDGHALKRKDTDMESLDEFVDAEG